MTETTSIKTLAENYDTTSARVQRIKKAVRLSFGENMTHEEIADELNLKRRQTVTEYLNSDVAEEFKAPYSARENYEIQKAFEEKFEDLEDKAENLFDMVREAGTFDQNIKALRELRQVNKDVAEFAMEIGALDKEAEKHEVEHDGVPPVQIITGEEASGEPQGATGEDSET